MGQGEFFAVTPGDAAALLARTGQPQVQTLIDAIDEAWGEEWRLPAGKRWDLIHRCLADGTCRPGGGSYPLNHCVLGGFHLYGPDDGYTAVLVTGDQAGDVNGALAALPEEWLRRRYTELFGPEYGGPVPEEDLIEVEGLFAVVKAFYRKASGAGRAVLFTTDESLSELWSPGR